MLRKPTEKELKSDVFNIIWGCIKNNCHIGKMLEDEQARREAVKVKLYCIDINYVVAIMDALDEAGVCMVKPPNNTISTHTILRDKNGTKKEFGRTVSFANSKYHSDTGRFVKRILDSWGRSYLDEEDNDIKKAIDEMEFGVK